MSNPAENRVEIIPAQDVNERYGVKRLQVEVGFLGRFFGSGTNAPANIGGFVLVLVILAYAAALFMSLNMQAADILDKVTLPVITLVLGYLFGKGK